MATTIEQQAIAIGNMVAPTGPFFSEAEIETYKVNLPRLDSIKSVVSHTFPADECGAGWQEFAVGGQITIWYVDVNHVDVSMHPCDLED
jgi:hypothetical protein